MTFDVCILVFDANVDKFVKEKLFVSENVFQKIYFLMGNELLFQENLKLLQRLREGAYRELVCDFIFDESEVYRR